MSTFSWPRTKEQTKLGRALAKQPVPLYRPRPKAKPIVMSYSTVLQRLLERKVSNA